MINMNNLNIGDISDNGQITIIDEDRLCYLVQSTSKGATGIRTISKALLKEYIDYFNDNPNSSANEARNALCGKSEIDKFEYGYTSTLRTMAKMVLNQTDTDTYPVQNEEEEESKFPLQQIYYGAPGTGKSHTINKITEAQPKENVFRTTFHPDSDYSTFVGAYKPTKEKSLHQEKRNISSIEDLAKILNDYYTNSETGKVDGIRKFCYDYCSYINGEYMKVNAKELARLANITENYGNEIDKYINFCKLIPKQNSGKITYEFVPQSFSKAYIRAWQTEEPVYLVIEEINRGNCAQIFGDLFQLLDRGDNGYSEYPIKADNDLAQYLAEQFSNNSREDIPENVKNGDELVLPSNLYIWATMNTSDQSLFPIDSAFKRRWNWVYIPIDTQKEDWYIQIGGSQYSWTDFLNKANDELLTDETAEDKHLGFYFCKPTVKENENDDEPTIITQDSFVSKVLFYLWTDVFKVYGIPSSIGNNKDWSFAKFYNENGSVDVNHVKELMDKLNITDDTDTKNLKAVKFPDGEIVNNTNGSTFDTYIQCVEKIGVNKIAEVADKIKYRRSGSPVISTTKYPELISSNKYSYHKIGDLYFVKGARSSLYVKILKALNNLLDVKMEIIN